MSTVGFIVHPNRPEAAQLALESKQLLERLGHDVVEFDASKDDTFADCDLLLSLGGDGTMLRAVELVSGTDTPILGVNLGRLGYLAEVDPRDLQTALRRFFEGDYHIQRRMTVAVQLERESTSEVKGSGRDPSPLDLGIALNEVVVERLHSGHVIRVEVAISGRKFIRYDADGLIVATPTGSTAYSLSARGPIASPELEALLLTPISPHMLFDRALVLAPSEVVTLRLCDGPPASVMVDGQNIMNIHPGDTVVCRRANHNAHLVTFENRSFHEILKAKFGLDSKSIGG